MLLCLHKCRQGLLVRSSQDKFYFLVSMFQKIWNNTGKELIIPSLQSLMPYQLFAATVLLILRFHLSSTECILHMMTVSRTKCSVDNYFDQREVCWPTSKLRLTTLLYPFMDIRHITVLVIFCGLIVWLCYNMDHYHLSLSIKIHAIHKAILSIFYRRRIPTEIFVPCRRKKIK